MRPQRAQLSLRDFLWRSRVLTQYRAFFRATRELSPSAAADARAQVRENFRARMGESDRGVRVSALAEGERQLAIVRKSASLASVADARFGGRASEGAPIIDTTDTSGSWVGTGAPDDVRGRVGAGWPWG